MKGITTRAGRWLVTTVLSTHCTISVYEGNYDAPISISDIIPLWIALFPFMKGITTGFNDIFHFLYPRIIALFPFMKGITTFL